MLLFSVLCWEVKSGTSCILGHTVLLSPIHKIHWEGGNRVQCCGTVFLAGFLPFLLPHLGCLGRCLLPFLINLQILPFFLLSPFSLFAINHISLPLGGSKKPAVSCQALWFITAFSLYSNNQSCASAAPSLPTFLPQ